MRTLSAHKKAITALAFSRDGTRLAEAAHGGKVRLWNAVANEVEQTFDASEGLFPNQVKLAFTPDQQSLAVANDRVKLFELASGNSVDLPGKRSAFHGLHISADGDELLADGDELFRWNLSNNTILPGFKLPKPPGKVGMVTWPGAAFSPDGTLVAVARREWNAPNANNVNRIFVLARDTHTVLAEFACTGHDPKRLAFSPDNRWLAAATGPVLRVYNLSTREECVALTVSKLHFLAAAFSPNGELLATVNKDCTTRLWETGVWREPKVYDWEIGKLLDLAFAPDGATVAVASDRGTILLFDVD